MPATNPTATVAATVIAAVEICAVVHHQVEAAAHQVLRCA